MGLTGPGGPPGRRRGGGYPALAAGLTQINSQGLSGETRPSSLFHCLDTARMLTTPPALATGILLTTKLLLAACLGPLIPRNRAAHTAVPVAAAAAGPPRRPLWQPDGRAPQAAGHRAPPADGRRDARVCVGNGTRRAPGDCAVPRARRATHRLSGPPAPPPPETDRRRGVDQVLPHHVAPTLYEGWVRDAREYVAMAEEVGLAPSGRALGRGAGGRDVYMYGVPGSRAADRSGSQPFCCAACIDRGSINSVKTKPACASNGATLPVRRATPPPLPHARQVNGPLPPRRGPEYPWGIALADAASMAPDAFIVNLETALTTHPEPWPGKGINYRCHPGGRAPWGGGPGARGGGRAVQ